MSRSVEELVSKAYDYGVLAEREDLPEDEKKDFIQEIQGESV
jgi:hypothetical protein